MTRSAFGFTLVSADDWRLQAACSPETAELFWPAETRGRTGISAKNRQAIRICLDCPVRGQCLRDALAHPEPFDRIVGGRLVRAVTRRRQLAAQRRELVGAS